jgi:hypothetical protein
VLDRRGLRVRVEEVVARGAQEPPQILSPAVKNAKATGAQSKAGGGLHRCRAGAVADERLDGRRERGGAGEARW